MKIATYKRFPDQEICRQLSKVEGSTKKLVGDSKA